MKELTAFINARLQSSRIPQKLTRPFAGTTLLRLALEKLDKMDFATKRYFCIAEEELAPYVNGLKNVEILWRDKASVAKGDPTPQVVYAHYFKFPTPWFMFVNPCLPFVSLDSYRHGFDVMNSTDFLSYTSVTKKKIWVFDATGEPLVNKDPNGLSTKRGEYSRWMNHAFHMVNKEYFARSGGLKHWEMTKDSPHLIEIPEHETIDVDTELEFNICETLYKGGYPSNYIRDNMQTVEMGEAQQQAKVQIGHFDLSDASRTLIIAEVGCSHEGSLGTAYKFIDVAAQAGVDAIKFQTHIAEAESTEFEPFRVKFSDQDATRKDYWKRIEFTGDQWKLLKAHADKRGLLFLSTPFSEEAVDLLTRVGVPAWKVGSGDLTDDLLLMRMAKANIPILLSTGMSSWTEIDHAVDLLKKRHIPLVLMQCTSAYPCPPEMAGLNNIKEFIERYKVPVGYSNHSPNIAQSLAAVCFGAQVIEFHLTLSKDMFGPDVPSSLTPQKASELVSSIREIEKIRQSRTNKDILASDLKDLRQIFQKSLVAKRELSKGEILQLDLLLAKKPLKGIPANKWEEVIGKKLNKGIKQNEFIQLDNLT